MVSAKLKMIFSVVLLLLTSTVFASGRNPQEDSRDPYMNIPYNVAFNQDAVYKGFRTTITKEHNQHVFKPGDDGGGCYNSWVCRKLSGRPSDGGKANSALLDSALEADFLKKKKSSAYLQVKSNAKGYAVFAPSMSGIVYFASYFLPANLIGFGAGITVFVVAEQGGMIIQKATEQYFKVRNYTGDRLEGYELEYARLKRYLPPDLCERIEKKFIAARTNMLEGIEHTKFFDIAFKLPRQLQAFEMNAEDKGPAPAVEIVVEPAPGVPPLSSRENERKFYDAHVDYIDNQFAAYEESRKANHQFGGAIWQHLKMYNHVFEYVPLPFKALPQEKEGMSKRRIPFLWGPGGLGKTTIVKKVALKYGMKLINIDLGRANTTDKLIGTEKEPGELLTKLSLVRERNAVLFFDEATLALNKMTPVFKTLLEADHGFFYSPYLKENIYIDGHLILVAGNLTPEGEGIKDEALRSRFVNIAFPKFRREYLDEYVRKFMGPDWLSNRPYVTEESLSKLEKNILSEAIAKHDTLREIGNEFPGMIYEFDAEASRQRRGMPSLRPQVVTVHAGSAEEKKQ